jgi:Fe-S-cluster containining protein
MSTYLRRKILIDRMQELEGQGFGCQGCQGNCCTFEANSMMVTPLEALDLMRYLSEQQRLTPALKEQCQQTITKYRLGLGLGNGKRSFLRRTYTCPFFNHTELGCPLPREVKPYGCLAFNAHDSQQKAADQCFSELAGLEAREQSLASESELNQQIRLRYQLAWDKITIPEALLALWDQELIAVDQ